MNMDRLKFEEKRRDIRRLRTCHEALGKMNNELTFPARRLLANEISRLVNQLGIGWVAFDHLAWHRIGKKENRMKYHPTPKLKGI